MKPCVSCVWIRMQAHGLRDKTQIIARSTNHATNRHRLNPVQPKGATMALTFSLVDTWDDGKRIHVSGTIAASGSYATGGDTLDLSQTPIVASSQPPINGTAWMDGLAGYDYVFTPGAAMSSNKVKIFQQGASAGAFPELAAGAYPGAITADSITFYGIFKKLQ